MTPVKKQAVLPIDPKLKASSTVSPMKVGDQATVKMPKAKKPASPFGKPSLFLKSEKMKKPSIEKLRLFMENKRNKRQ